MYSQTTENIKVTVSPYYLENQSDPVEEQYAWAYHVIVENEGDDIVQLISRHWKITDESGYTKEVKGAGVIGEQPVLRPGQSFEYTSGTLLPTPSGVMFGTYQMLSQAKNKEFDIIIPAFSLDSPEQHAIPN